jgi:hypothetical protein
MIYRLTVSRAASSVYQSHKSASERQVAKKGWRPMRCFHKTVLTGEVLLRGKSCARLPNLTNIEQVGCTRLNDTHKHVTVHLICPGTMCIEILSDLYMCLASPPRQSYLALLRHGACPRFLYSHATSDNNTGWGYKVNLSEIPRIASESLFAKDNFFLLLGTNFARSCWRQAGDRMTHRPGGLL